MKIRHKKIKVVILLLFFITVAGYLCPCKSHASNGSDFIIKNPHRSCCDQMPNCPLEKDSQGGIQSLVSSFIKSDISFAFLPDQLLSYSLPSFFQSVHPTEKPSLAFITEKERYLEFSPPDLTIQYANFRI